MFSQYRRSQKTAYVIAHLSMGFTSTCTFRQNRTCPLTISQYFPQITDELEVLSFYKQRNKQFYYHLAPNATKKLPFFCCIWLHPCCERLFSARPSPLKPAYQPPPGYLSGGSDLQKA
jgi:hypothetical protein